MGPQLVHGSTEATLMSDAHRTCVPGLHVWAITPEEGSAACRNIFPIWALGLYRESILQNDVQ